MLLLKVPFEDMAVRNPTKENRMRVCLIAAEIFAWGVYGGFGRATRTIGRELVRSGVDVFAVVPRRQNQRPVEMLDGIKVLSFPAHNPLVAGRLFREINADIHHSAEAQFLTYMAMKALPRKKHVITFRDPRDAYDWKLEFQDPTFSRLRTIPTYLYYENMFVRQAVRKADALFTAARYLQEKVKNKYALEVMPHFLPTPVSVPERIEKATRPTVCYNARWDRRKKPERFLALAEQYPDIGFIAIGKSQDTAWDMYLRTKYVNVPNLEMTGLIDQFASDRLFAILEKSWIMVNTSTREGLPNSFLEACAHKCAIMSNGDADQFCSRFGCHVTDGDFAKGLDFLLENDRWKERGAAGYDHMKEVFQVEKSMQLHIEWYNKVLVGEPIYPSRG
jgi:hypothetical protein